MDTPKNCRECKHNRTCQSYYGGSVCKHNEKITSEAIRKMNIK